MQSKKLEKSFRSGLTAMALAILLFLLVSSTSMILIGLSSRSRYLPEDQFLCCFLPAIIGVCILGLWIFNIASQLGQVITITPRSFHYRKGGFELQSSWDDLIYDGPEAGKKFLKSLTFCNGDSTVTIYDIYFPDFPTLAKVMSAAKKKADEAFGL